MFASVAPKTCVEVPSSECIGPSVCIAQGRSIFRYLLGPRPTQLQAYRGHNDDVTCLAQIDGAYLVSASHDRSILVWCLATGVVVRRIASLKATSTALCVEVRSGKCVVWCSDSEGAIQAWSIDESPRCLLKTNVLEHGPAPERIVSQTPSFVAKFVSFDDKMLCVGSDGRLHVFARRQWAYLGFVGDTIRDLVSVRDDQFVVLRCNGNVASIQISNWSQHVEIVVDDADSTLKGTVIALDSVSMSQSVPPTSSDTPGLWQGTAASEIQVKVLWEWVPNDLAYLPADGILGVELFCAGWLDLVAVSRVLYHQGRSYGQLSLLQLKTGSLVALPGLDLERQIPSKSRRRKSSGHPYNSFDPTIADKNASGDFPSKWSSLRTGMHVAGSLGLGSATAARKERQTLAIQHNQEIMDQNWMAGTVFQQLSVVGTFLVAICSGRRMGFKSKDVLGAASDMVVWDLSSFHSVQQELQRHDPSSIKWTYPFGVAKLCYLIEQHVKDYVADLEAKALRQQEAAVDENIADLLAQSAAGVIDSGQSQTKSQSHGDCSIVVSGGMASLSRNVSNVLDRASEISSNARKWVQEWDKRRNPWRHETIDDEPDSDNGRNTSSSKQREASLTEFSDDSSDESVDDARSAAAGEASQSVHSPHIPTEDDIAAYEDGQDLLGDQMELATQIDAVNCDVTEANRQLERKIARLIAEKQSVSQEDRTLHRLDLKIDAATRLNRALKRALQQKLDLRRRSVGMPSASKSRQNAMRSASKLDSIGRQSACAVFASLLDPSVRQSWISSAASDGLLPPHMPATHSRNLDGSFPCSHSPVGGFASSSDSNCLPETGLVPLSKLLFTADAGGQSSGPAAWPKLPENESKKGFAALSPGDPVVIISMHDVAFESCDVVSNNVQSKFAQSNLASIGVGSIGKMIATRKVVSRWSRSTCVVKFVLCYRGTDDLYEISLRVPTESLMKITWSSVESEYLRPPLPPPSMEACPPVVNSVSPIMTHEIGIPDLQPVAEARRKTRWGENNLLRGVVQATPYFSFSMADAAVYAILNRESTSKLCSFATTQDTLLGSEASVNAQGHGSSPKNKRFIFPEDWLDVWSTTAVTRNQAGRTAVGRIKLCDREMQDSDNLTASNTKHRFGNLPSTPLLVTTLSSGQNRNKVGGLSCNWLGGPSLSPHIVCVADLSRPRHRSKQQSKYDARARLTLRERREKLARQLSGSFPELQSVAFAVVLLSHDSEAWKFVVHNLCDMIRGVGPGRVDHNALLHLQLQAWEIYKIAGLKVGARPGTHRVFHGLVDRSNDSEIVARLNQLSDAVSAIFVRLMLRHKFTL